MKIFYLNDENETVTIRVNGQLRPSAVNPYGEAQMDYFRLAPQESRVIEVDAPEGAIPYVKRWENRVVLLSYILPSALELSQPSSSK